MMDQELALGFSPCPNDTFMFHGWVNGHVGIPGVTVRPHLADVETLNQMASERRLDVSKLSFYAWLRVSGHYRLLETGAAMGHGCGPVLVSLRPLNRNDMPHCRIVLPGEGTTAHLLFRLWAPSAGARVFARYDEILPMVCAGDADAGVIIHETRFTYAASGCRPVVDLGAWWESQTGLPIPLGGIAADRRLGDDMIARVTAVIAQSIHHARSHPASTRGFVQRHAQEMAPEILARHIDTFVNDFSMGMSQTGQAAIDRLRQMALDAGVLG